MTSGDATRTPAPAVKSGRESTSKRPPEKSSGPMPARPTGRSSKFQIGDISVLPGHKITGELPISRLVTGTRIALPIQIIHGRRSGPTIWLSAAVHGDELAGVEIIRRVVNLIDAKQLSGTVITVPIVNVHGFLNGNRYLPDRRDLNRSFPGSATGSLAARIAHLFMNEIVSRCEFGIDLHTGSDGRANLPQIRSNLDDKRTRKLSEAFGAPVMLHAKLRDGSLRAAANERGVPVLLFEGGEANRLDSVSIETAVSGVLRVMVKLGMIEGAGGAASKLRPVVECRDSSWLRARRSGIALLDVELGRRVEAGQLLGVIHDSVGKRLSRINASRSGIVIGRLQEPLVNQGDAVIHIAEEKQQ